MGFLSATVTKWCSNSDFVAVVNKLNRLGDGRKRPSLSAQSFVEMRGIEPRSTAEIPRLLRAQFATIFSAPIADANNTIDGLSLSSSPDQPRGATDQQATFMTPGSRTAASRA